VLRTDLSGDPTFRELLRRVRESVLGAYAYQEMPFDKIVEALRPKRERGRTPLFDVKLVLQNAPKGSAEGLKELDARPLGIDGGAAKFDWLLDLTETTRGLYAELKYNEDLYDETTVTRFLERYETLLRLATDEPDARLSALAESLERAERQSLIAKHEALKGFGRRRPKSAAPKPSESKG
jgi:aspartate racemase